MPMKTFTQEHAQRMYTMLHHVAVLLEKQKLNRPDSATIASENITELLAEIDSERKVSERQITSTHLTTDEYAAIHAVNKRFKTGM